MSCLPEGAIAVNLCALLASKVEKKILRNKLEGSTWIRPILFIMNIGLGYVIAWGLYKIMYFT